MGVLTYIMPIVGAGAGAALIGGPIGLAGGLVVGLGIGLVFDKPATPAVTAPAVPVALPKGPPPTVKTFAGGMSLTATQVGLPAGADMNAALTATRMLIVNTPAVKAAAGAWLKQFQTSVGLPGTGTMDPATRAMLVRATTNNAPAGVDARKIPAKTILG